MVYKASHMSICSVSFFRGYFKVLSHPCFNLNHPCLVVKGFRFDIRTDNEVLIWAFRLKGNNILKTLDIKQFPSALL